MISLQNLHKRFGAQPVLRDVSLDFPDKSYIALLGPSGSGKSTLLRAIAGLSPLDTGRITVEDQVFLDTKRGIDMPPEHRRIGMVFQNYAVWPHRTVFDNVAYPLHHARLAKADVAVRVQAVLQRVGLATFAERMPATLSGGQQQRVALARALAMEPRALLLDEPLANLDVHLRADLCDQFRASFQAQPPSFVHVTHDRDEALSLATHIVVLRDGCVEQVGSPTAVFQRPASRFVAELVAQGLGFTSHLASDLRDGHADTTAPTLNGRPLRAQWLAPQAPKDKGCDVVVPRHALLFPAPPDVPHLAATVVGSNYAGTHRQLVVRMQGSMARLPVALETPTPETGEEVAVGVKQAWAFAPS